MSLSRQVFMHTAMLCCRSDGAPKSSKDIGAAGLHITSRQKEKYRISNRHQFTFYMSKNLKVF
jgi:hypothetical protein